MECVWKRFMGGGYIIEIWFEYLIYIIYIVEKWWRIVLKIKYYIYFVILNYFKCFINLVDY